MPAVYTGMPFRLEARFYDPDNFSQPLRWVWMVTRQPPDSNLVFLDTTSITPRVVVDKPGRYDIELAVFDGLDTTRVPYFFNVEPAWSARAEASGSCLAIGAGVDTSPPQFIRAEATSIISEADAVLKAQQMAQAALAASLSCCPASLQLTLPRGAPSGSQYFVSVLPADALPHQDFPWSDSGDTTVITVGLSVEAGDTIELYNTLGGDAFFRLDRPVTLQLAVLEPDPLNGLVEPADFDLELEALEPDSLAGARLEKRQRHAAIYPANAPFSRALRYELFLPNAKATRLKARVIQRLPPIPGWQFNAGGWDWAARRAGESRINALGLFLLTEGTLDLPQTEVRLFTMREGIADLDLLNMHYDFSGFSRLPYRGSLYGYSDRRALAAIPHLGFIAEPDYGDIVEIWTDRLYGFITRNQLSPPYHFYFRTGYYTRPSGYTWYPDSVPLWLERQGSDVALGSLEAGTGILPAAQGVISLNSLKPVNSFFFATVAKAPALFLDWFRALVGAPQAAVKLGVYFLPEWPRLWQADRIAGFSASGPPAGRGYDCTNLARELDTLLQKEFNNDIALAFYYEDEADRPVAGFPLAARNLTSYPGTGFELTNFEVFGSTVPPARGNVLIYRRGGTKVYLVNRQA